MAPIAEVARRTSVMDANQAVADVAYRVNEVIAIYPITPASAMGELADEWAARGRQNLWGSVPTIIEMQSEGGAAGAVHGALQGGALSTTFTASQGLLLMIPNLYKIAGELTPFVLHVAARTIATHALSIFCDHSDVMACRQTGFALLCSDTVQQASDFAAIAQAATLECRVPFLHFFDGFRTSHELVKVEPVQDESLRCLIDDRALRAHRARALSPDRPVVRGTAQNPDSFFQAREAANPFYARTPDVVARAIQRFGELSGRRHELFSYVGHPRAERVLVVMGSAAQTARETVRALERQGERVGVLSVHLFRPFSVRHFLAALPATTRAISVLDRTKEPGAVGEPLYLDVVSAVSEGWDSGRPPRVSGGRYGLSSKEFTPAHARAALDDLCSPEPRRHFSLGIIDDVSHEALSSKEPPDLPRDGLLEAVFFGLGSDGTVGANKNTIKIVGDETPLHVQGYFVYDSKKAGAVTVSHLRFSQTPLEKPYLITAADFVACHQFNLLERDEVLSRARPGAVLLLNSPYAKQTTWEHLSSEARAQIREKRLRVYVIDAYRLAGEAGLGRHINTVMQACFFALAKLLPIERALEAIALSVAKTYGKQGPEVVERNIAAVDRALAGLAALELPDTDVDEVSVPRRIPEHAPDFVKRVTAALIAGHGDELPVSAFPVDGTWPVGTSQWEKRGLATAIPVWEPTLCIECNKCVALCPHAAIRAKVYEPSAGDGAPDGFPAIPWKGTELAGQSYTLQVAPDDCTGCRLCVEVCPAKDKSDPRRKALAMQPRLAICERERERFAFFELLPEVSRDRVHLDLKGSQLLRPLFEYSGACAGCGETAYVKLLTQLFGDRALIANATGCSSIYGGNLPTTPYTTDASGRGPAWANSLFEDNAEFGLGLRLAVDVHTERARVLTRALASELGDELVSGLLGAQPGEAGIAAQRRRIEALRAALRTSSRKNGAEARELDSLADYLVPKSVWLVGGDGWAYDIGFGGLDHVLSGTQNVNVLVLDTEVYSNTGGQKSKATPLGATAKFAANGKDVSKKDLGLLAMSYGHVYVARVAFGAKDAQTVRAFVEAEAYPGPSLIIAYSPCIAHGYDLAFGARQQKLAVDSGVWPLFRFDPRRSAAGEPPLELDSGPIKIKASEYMRNEARFRQFEQRDETRFEALFRDAEREARERIEIYQQLSHVHVSRTPEKA